MKRIFISLLQVMLIFAVTFSITAFAKNYTIGDWPCEIEKVPQEEQELSSEIKEKILQKLLKTEYSDSNPDDIVIRYYGTLNNGAMLINHYNKTYTYPELAKSYEKVAIYFNIDFGYYCPTEMDKVKLYMYGEIYTFKDAYDSGLLNLNDLCELVNVVDGFYFMITNWADTDSEVLGDVNGDGNLTVLDATLIQKKVLNLVEFTDSETECADVNADGKVYISDVTQVQKSVAGIA